LTPHNGLPLQNTCRGTSLPPTQGEYFPMLSRRDEMRFIVDREMGERLLQWTPPKCGPHFRLFQCGGDAGRATEGKMTFSVYDSKALRTLSEALASVMLSVGGSATPPLTAIERSNAEKRATVCLLNAFDLGERDPAALERAALEGLSVNAVSACGAENTRTATPHSHEVYNLAAIPAPGTQPRIQSGDIH
jgi:hypothetical protein